MKKADVIAHIEAMYNHLQEARDIAGDLRSVFSGDEWRQHRDQLKQMCNQVRAFRGALISKDLASFLVETTKEAK